METGIVARLVMRSIQFIQQNKVEGTELYYIDIFQL